MALPSAGTLTGNANNLTLSNATDVAGHVTLDFNATGVASNFPVVFGYPYSSSLNPVTVILSAANDLAAQDMNCVFVQGITSDAYTMFTICFNANYTNIGTHEYNYHVFESQKDNATGSTFAIAIGGGSTLATVTQGTDMCGVLDITTKTTAGVGCTLTYGYQYAVAPIVLFTPKITTGAVDITRVYQGSSTVNNFTIDIDAGCTANNHRYMYHIIETQAGNATFPAISATTYVAGSQARTKCTDVAGNIQILTTTAAGTVSFPYATATPYIIAPIVVFSPINSVAAKLMNGCWVTSNTTYFTMHIPTNAGPANGTANFAYHVIETQA